MVILTKGWLVVKCAKVRSVKEDLSCVISLAHFRPLKGTMISTWLACFHRDGDRETQVNYYYVPANFA